MTVFSVLFLIYFRCIPSLPMDKIISPALYLFIIEYLVSLKNALYRGEMSVMFICLNIYTHL